MRYKVYFVVETDYHLPNPRWGFDHTAHTVYQIVEMDESTPIKDIIDAAKNKFDPNPCPTVTTEVLRFQSIFDADFKASLDRSWTRASIAKVGGVTLPQPVFRLEQAIDQDSDVLCVLCSSKAVGVFKCKDGVSKPLCSLHRALEVMK